MTPGNSVLLICGAVLLGACSAFAPYKTARPLGKGATQTFVATQLNGAGPKETQKVPVPELALAVRHGLTPAVEVSGTVTALPLGRAGRVLGAEVFVQKHLARALGGRLDIAAGAGMGYRNVASSGAMFEMVHASLPLIAGINLGDDQLIIAPTLSWQRWYSTGAMPVSIPAAGVSLGYRWQITPGFALFPEISAYSSPTALTGFGDTAMFHAGIALVFGRYR